VSDRALPMMCPPFTALLFAPLSFFSFWWAYSLFLAINVGLLMASAAVMAKYLPCLSTHWRAGPTALWLAFFPAGVAVMMGQISALLLLIYCLCFAAWRRGDAFAAGLILSLALMKFQVAAPVAVLFMLWRQWRFVVGFLSGALVLTGISTAVLGPRNMIPYLHSLVSMTSSISPDRAVQLHFGIFPELMPNLFGLLFSLTHGAHVGTVLVFVVSAALMVWAATRRPSVPLALLVGMLVSYHLFLYDLTILLLPLGFVVNSLLADGEANAAHEAMRKQTWGGQFWVKLSAAVLILSPVEVILVSRSASYLLALPILAITLWAGWGEAPAGKTSASLHC
jgi:hypothetical protein